MPCVITGTLTDGNGNVLANKTILTAPTLPEGLVASGQPAIAPWPQCTTDVNGTISLTVPRADECVPSTVRWAFLLPTGGIILGAIPNATTATWAALTTPVAQGGDGWAIVTSAALPAETAQLLGLPTQPGPPVQVPGPAGLNWRGSGVWSFGTVYAQNDAVTYNGSTYRSLTNGNAGNTPGSSPTAWSLLAQAGAAGATGPPGPSGSGDTPGNRVLSGLAATGGNGLALAVPAGSAIVNGTIVSYAGGTLTATDNSTQSIDVSASGSTAVPALTGTDLPAAGALRVARVDTVRGVSTVTSLAPAGPVAETNAAGASNLLTNSTLTNRASTGQVPHYTEPFFGLLGWDSTTGASVAGNVCTLALAGSIQSQLYVYQDLTLWVRFHDDAVQFGQRFAVQSSGQHYGVEVDTSAATLKLYSAPTLGGTRTFLATLSTLSVAGGTGGWYWLKLVVSGPVATATLYPDTAALVPNSSPLTLTDGVTNATVSSSLATTTLGALGLVNSGTHSLQIGGVQSGTGYQLLCTPPDGWTPNDLGPFQNEQYAPTWLASYADTGHQVVAMYCPDSTHVGGYAQWVGPQTAIGGGGSYTFSAQLEVAPASGWATNGSTGAALYLGAGGQQQTLLTAASTGGYAAKALTLHATPPASRWAQPMLTSNVFAGTLALALPSLLPAAVPIPAAWQALDATSAARAYLDGLFNLFVASIQQSADVQSYLKGVVSQGFGAHVPLVARLGPGQHGDIFEAQNEAGTGLVTIDESGNIAIAGNATVGGSVSQATYPTPASGVPAIRLGAGTYNAGVAPDFQGTAWLGANLQPDDAADFIRLEVAGVAVASIDHAGNMTLPTVTSTPGPSLTPQFSALQSGNTTNGVHKLCYTFFDGGSGSNGADGTHGESDPSPVLTVDTTAGGALNPSSLGSTQLTINNIESTGTTPKMPSGYDTRKVYMTQAGGSTFYYVKNVAGALTNPSVTISSSDATIGANATRPVSGAVTPTVTLGATKLVRDSTGALIVNAPSGSTKALRLQINGSDVVQWDSTGTQIGGSVPTHHATHLPGGTDTLVLLNGALPDMTSPDRLENIARKPSPIGTTAALTMSGVSHNGSLHLSLFEAPCAFTAGHVEVILGSTAGANIGSFWVVVYSLNGSRQLAAELARTKHNDAALPLPALTANTAYTLPLYATDETTTKTVAFAGNTFYAVGVLAVDNGSTPTAPTLRGNAHSAIIAALTPTISGLVASLTAPPTVFPVSLAQGGTEPYCNFTA